MAGLDAPREREAAVRGSDVDLAPKNRWVVLTIVLAAVFMQLLDTTITTVAIPSIQSSLNTTFGQVQLVLAGYSLAFA